jgi:hypothetical protein
LAKQGEVGGAKDVKERHVVIEHVAILEPASDPSPDDMRVLSLIGIDAKAADGHQFEAKNNREYDAAHDWVDGRADGGGDRISSWGEGSVHLTLISFKDL